MKVLEPRMIFPNEKIVHVTGYHWIYVFRSFWPFALVMTIGTFAWALVPARITSVIIMIALIASLVWIAMKVMDTIVKRCYITNRRLINRSGWTKRDTQDITLDRIGGVFLDQTPMERFLGYGKIRLLVPVIQIPLPEYLSNPIAFRNSLYIKPAEEPDEKPEDDVLEAERDRLAREEDDRFGVETVSFKELQESVEDVDLHEIGADLDADTDFDPFSDQDAASDDALADASDNVLADAGGDGSDGSET